MFTGQIIVRVEVGRVLKVVKGIRQENVEIRFFFLQLKFLSGGKEFKKFWKYYF